MNRKELLDAAQGILDGAKAAARDLTSEEQAQVKAYFDQIEELDRKTADSRELVARLDSLGKGSAPDTKAAGQVWAKTVADALGEKAGSMGVKSLFTGEVDTPPAVAVAPLPQRPTRLLDVIGREGLTENTFEYLQQTVATNNAAPVADGATKPTSTYTWTPREDWARVIAHLSEPFPIRFMQDHTSAMQVLEAQMLNGLLQALEEQIIAGDGTGENFTGVLNASGIGVQAFATDVPTTLRRARTTLENLGVAVNGVVMNPSDIEALDLIREDGATGGYLMDSDAYERIFGRSGLSPIPSIHVPAGSAIVGDWSQVRLRVRQTGHTMAATQAGDLFDTNRMKLRAEGRYGLENRQPGNLTLVSLTAGP